MLRFELRHYMYLPLYLSHALCHPSTGVPVCLSVSPGFPSSASLRRDKPPLMRLHTRATIYRPSTGALISAGIRPQGIPYKLPSLASFSRSPKCEIQNTKYAKPLRRGEPKYIVPAGERPPNLIAPAWGRNSLGRGVSPC